MTDPIRAALAAMPTAAPAPGVRVACRHYDSCCWPKCTCPPEPAQAAPDDLVERLRDVLRNWTNVTDDEQAVIRDAADALARLRAELAAERDGAANWRQHFAEADERRLRADRERAERAEAERDALRADAERWQTLCNLWMACTILTLTQDEDGRWSIEATEPVDSETFATLTGDDPDAAIDAARGQP